MDHQKTNSMIYHVPEEETKRKVKGQRMCRRPLSSKIQPQIGSSSHIVTSCFHVGSYMMNALDYNYKLRNIIGREDDFIANKWKWFDTQVCDIFLWS